LIILPCPLSVLQKDIINLKKMENMGISAVIIGKALYEEKAKIKFKKKQ